MSQAPSAVQVAVEDEQVVVFDVASESYAVNIARVHEIIRLQQITVIPGAPPCIEGVINLRGKVIPVLDLRKRFSLLAAEHTRASRIVVVEIGGQTIGLVVDGVSEVLRIMTDRIEPPSPLVTGIDSRYLRGIAKLEDRLIVLLDLDQVLSPVEQQQLETSDLR
ncbi:MAG: purine-binding chemotaxis protein CheW [Ktedonobacterales bacterium]|nr:purine-binding chemotaxis protein CheW [Ktedonobacterales bacterium]